MGGLEHLRPAPVNQNFGIPATSPVGVVRFYECDCQFQPLRPVRAQQQIVLNPPKKRARGPFIFSLPLNTTIETMVHFAAFMSLAIMGNSPIGARLSCGSIPLGFYSSLRSSVVVCHIIMPQVSFYKRPRESRVRLSARSFGQ